VYIKLPMYLFFMALGLDDFDGGNSITSKLLRPAPYKTGTLTGILRRSPSSNTLVQLAGVRVRREYSVEANMKHIFIRFGANKICFIRFIRIKANLYI
jgi:hypothetical protein